MGENPVVEAKKRLTEAMRKETSSLKENYERLKGQPEVKVKRYFAHKLQTFCTIVDGTKDVVETYFAHSSVPVSMIRAMEDYYATFKVVLSEFPEVAMDPKLQKAVSGVFLPYQQVLGRLSDVADRFVAQERAKGT